MMHLAPLKSGTGWRSERGGPPAGRDAEPRGEAPRGDQAFSLAAISATCLP